MYYADKPNERIRRAVYYALKLQRKNLVDNSQKQDIVNSGKTSSIANKSKLTLTEEEAGRLKKAHGWTANELLVKTGYYIAD